MDDRNRSLSTRRNASNPPGEPRACHAGRWSTLAIESEALRALRFRRSVARWAASLPPRTPLSFGYPRFGGGLVLISGGERSSTTLLNLDSPPTIATARSSVPPLQIARSVIDLCFALGPPPHVSHKASKRNRSPIGASPTPTGRDFQPVGRGLSLFPGTEQAGWRPPSPTNPATGRPWAACPGVRPPEPLLRIRYPSIFPDRGNGGQHLRTFMRLDKKAASATPACRSVALYGICDRIEPAGKTPDRKLSQNICRNISELP